MLVSRPQRRKPFTSKHLFFSLRFRLGLIFLNLPLRSVPASDRLTIPVALLLV